MKKLIRNRKGTAEIVGSVMFIIILLFFFTNVYLWHDAATREMNDLYVERVNSPVTVSVILDVSDFASALNVTNKGGIDATVCKVWVDVRTVNGGPDKVHLGFNDTVVVRAGESSVIQLAPFAVDNYIQNDPIQFKVITTVGNSAACDYSPPTP
jgi:hypothetical protein